MICTECKAKFSLAEWGDDDPAGEYCGQCAPPKRIERIKDDYQAKQLANIASCRTSFTPSPSPSLFRACSDGCRRKSRASEVDL